VIADLGETKALTNHTANYNHLPLLTVTSIQALQDMFQQSKKDSFWQLSNSINRALDNISSSNGLSGGLENSTSYVRSLLQRVESGDIEITYYRGTILYLLQSLCQSLEQQQRLQQKGQQQQLHDDNSMPPTSPTSTVFPLPGDLLGSLDHLIQLASHSAWFHFIVDLNYRLVALEKAIHSLHQKYFVGMEVSPPPSTSAFPSNSIESVNLQLQQPWDFWKNLERIKDHDRLILDQAVESLKKTSKILTLTNTRLMPYPQTMLLQSPSNLGGESQTSSSVTSTDGEEDTALVFADPQFLEIRTDPKILSVGINNSSLIFKARYKGKKVGVKILLTSKRTQQEPVEEASMVYEKAEMEMVLRRECVILSQMFPCPYVVSTRGVCYIPKTETPVKLRFQTTSHADTVEAGRENVCELAEGTPCLILDYPLAFSASVASSSGLAETKIRQLQQRQEEDQGKWFTLHQILHPHHSHHIHEKQPQQPQQQQQQHHKYSFTPSVKVKLHILAEISTCLTYLEACGVSGANLTLGEVLVYISGQKPKGGSGMVVKEQGVGMHIEVRLFGLGSMTFIGNHDGAAPVHGSAGGLLSFGGLMEAVMVGSETSVGGGLVSRECRALIGTCQNPQQSFLNRFKDVTRLLAEVYVPPTFSTAIVSGKQDWYIQNDTQSRSLPYLQTQGFYYGATATGATMWNYGGGAGGDEDVVFVKPQRKKKVIQLRLPKKKSSRLFSTVSNTSTTTTASSSSSANSTDDHNQKGQVLQNLGNALSIDEFSYFPDTLEVMKRDQEGRAAPTVPVYAPHLRDTTDMLQHQQHQPLRQHVPTIYTTDPSLPSNSSSSSLGIQGVRSPTSLAPSSSLASSSPHAPPIFAPPQHPPPQYESPKQMFAPLPGQGPFQRSKSGEIIPEGSYYYASPDSSPLMRPQGKWTHDCSFLSLNSFVG
jgi:hypothetical protein